MHRYRLMAVTALVVILLVGMDVQRAVDHPEMSLGDSDEPLALVDTQDLVQRALAEDPPRTPVNLRELVIELQNATPIANRTDYDNDLLYDPVEKVIGTDPTRNDTDSDQLSDYFEVMNGTDPLLPDSNYDGIYDFEEVNVTLDLDNDGVPNAWDFDNDGDGVNDDPDLSPFACTDALDTFDIQLQTDGKPTLINLQLKPEDVEHLKIASQTWNWPHDEDGIMQDIDDSIDDITISPFLRITTDQIPSQSALDEMLVISTEDGLLVRLTPVLEYETIVAFSGSLLYDGSVPSNIDLTAELIWKVDGATDIVAKTLKAEDDYLSVGQDMMAVCNATEGDALALEWIHIRENSERIRFALKIFDGPYLTVAPDNTTLVFNATELGPREEFLYWKQNDVITAVTGDRFFVNPEGLMILQYTPATTFEVVDRIYSSNTHLVTYTDPFIITGLTIEEFYGTEVGVFYNSTDKNQTIAASWLMTYRFANNATTTLEDIPGILASASVEVSNITESVRDKYEALVKLGNELFPSAMIGVPANMHYPIIAAIEDRSKVLDLSNLADGSYIVSSPCQFNLLGTEVITSKSMKMNWYNTSTKIAVAPVELFVDVALMDLSDIAALNLIGMLFRWDTGIHTITCIGSDSELFQSPDSEELAITSNVLVFGLEGLVFAAELIFAFKAWKELNIYVKNMGGNVAEVARRLQAIKDRYELASEIMDLVKDLGKNSKFCTWLKYSKWINANKNFKFLRTFKGFSKTMFVLGILVDIGIAVWSGIAIAKQIGGDVGREFGTIYAVTAAIIGGLIIAIMTIIGMIPVIGWLLAIVACIVDAVGGYSSKLIQWLTDWIFGTPMQMGFTLPNAYLDDVPDITIIDNEGNGFTAGDALKINGSLWGVIEADVFQAYVVRYDYRFTKTQIAQALIALSSLDPYIEYLVPTGTNDIVNEMPSNITAEVESSISEHPFKYVYRFKQEFGVLVYPSIAMNNYPITLRLHYPYTIMNHWKHYVFDWFGLFGGDSFHYDTESNLTTAYDVTTFKYDVFPVNLEEFLEWRIITPNDPDGDQLTSDLESANGLSAWKYDSDGDGLNDKYEVDSGLDGTKTDSDSDGVSDWYEHVYGTNATNSDTDEDGVSDFDEISGWIINFYYLDNRSLPFEIPVTSDPRNNDSDGDGVDDFEEFRYNTNPKSNDTDGNGKPDFSFDWITSEANYDTSTEWTFPVHPYGWASDICVDEDGFLYVTGHIGGPYSNYTIRKYDQSLQQIPFPQNSFFANFYINDYLATGIHSIAIDDKNEYLYLAEWVTESVDIWRFDMNGTVMPPGRFTVGDSVIDIDNQGNVYGLTYRSMRKTNSTGYQEYLFNVYGGSSSGLTHAVDFAVDDRFGFFYIVEDSAASLGPRVVKRRLSDFSYVEDFISPSSLNETYSVAVDDVGYVYLLCNDTTGVHVRKYRPNGEEDESFRFYGNGTHSLSAPFWSDFGVNQIRLGPDKSIYILENFEEGSDFRIKVWKFTQDIWLASELVPDTDPDWDNDGLTNTQEIDGWEITVNFPSGELTFNVTSNHLMNDSDLDGLGDYLEYTLGSNPRSPDTDQDGASDHYEWWLNQYPGVPYEPPLEHPAMAPTLIHQRVMMWMAAGPSLTDWDTDSDMLGDSVELTFGSSPVNPDSDGEGLSDLNEFIYNSNPNSPDSDGDGADDAYELAMNSSLLNADSDGDLIFDGFEYDSGTHPTIADQDGDGILDGIELYFGSNPRSNDSDGDGLLDSVEVSLWLDVNNNDTDGDGVLDGIEIAQGTDPWLTDSDWDGVPDNEDPDTLNPWGGHIALVYDTDASDDILAFGSLLGNYTQVTVYNAESFMDVNEDYQYVVLVGRPSASATDTAGLVYHLLEDTGTMLEAMMDTDTDNIAVRYSVWTDPQTVILMSGANTSDVFTILQILKYFEVSLLPDSVLVEFHAFDLGYNMTADYAYPVNTIDTVKTTDTALLILMNSPATPSIQISRYNQTTTPHVLSMTNGLEEGDTAIGRYIDVSITDSGATGDVFESALILFYYRAADLDLNGNGILGDVGDINETSLSLYHFDEFREEWVKMNSSLSWVMGMGLNTTDINVFGENYAGYIWIQTTKLSLFAIAGQTIHVGLGLMDTIILIAILGAVGIITVVFVYRWRKRRIEGKHLDLLSSLQSSLKMI
ncbi:MAG: hypothetical protein ACFFD3_13040 [Candidatus Thorarchaeota archaeon]